MSPTSAEDDGLFRGSSAQAREVRRLAVRAARVDSSVLVMGESGVGKELVARDIHLRSSRKSGPFIAVNCAAIPQNLVESELFGHERGAFTDARGERRGVFELAHGGTLFLDEIGDLSLEAQPKLLRVLETGEIQRVGGERVRRVDVRIVAATNADLKALCAEKRFRWDLFYRLDVLVIAVPPLRERLEDLPALADHFARELASKANRPYTRLTDDAVERLLRYHWPGNVRELKSAIERALALHSGHLLDLEAFDVAQSTSPGFSGLFDHEWKKARAAFESAFAQRVLLKHGGNVRAAAEEAGIAPRSLYKMIRRLGLRARPRRKPRGRAE
jgi:transcriptional regulator with PAS, ATPase and Fis domain